MSIIMQGDRELSQMQTDPEFAMHLLKARGYNPNNWTPDQLDVLSLCLAELHTSGDSKILRQLNNIDFWRTPPSIEEFLESPEFLGSICNADPEKNLAGIFPKWRELLYRDFHEGSDIDQLIFTGSIGLGKTFCGCIALLYKIAYALCLREPLGYYGLAKATQLVYSFFSVTQKQVKGGAFHDALSMMRNSPFFVDRIKDNLNNRKFADRRVELHGNVIIEAGSQTHDALGRNVLCSLIDEINFRLEAEAAEAAKELIDNIARRRTSRFGNTHKGLLIIISSAKNEADFLTGHINKNRNKSNVAIYDYPWWEVVGPIKMKGGYSGENFHVDIGDQTSPPKILNPQDVEETPEHRLLAVPVEHKQAFEDDLDGAIRDIAGKTTGRQSKFFGNIVPLLNSIKSDIPNSMEKETVQLSYGTEDSILEYIDPTILTQVRGGTVVPRRHSDAPRFIHMDMSSGAQDAMGFAMVHPVGLKKIDTFDRITGRKHELQKPIFEVDLAFRITRSDPNEAIDFGEVRSFIWWLYRQGKFKIKKVTADLLHMSRETLAILKQEGIDTGYLSVDKKLSLGGASGKGPQGAYHILRQTINERRFHTFPVEWLMLELLNLEQLDDKIDHPSEWHTKWPSIHSSTGFFEPGTSHASKDLADAICGAVYEATQYEQAYSNMKPENMVQVYAEMGSQPILNEGKPLGAMVM